MRQAMATCHTSCLIATMEDQYARFKDKYWWCDVDCTPTEVLILSDCYISHAGGQVAIGQIVELPAWEADMYYRLGWARYMEWPSVNKALFEPSEVK